MEIKPYLREPHYYETDQMGIIHHSNYIRWMEEARVDFMRQAGFTYQQAVECGIDFAVMDVSLSYRSMVRFGERVRILVRIKELSPMRLRVSYQMYDDESGILRNEGESGHCFYDGRRQRPVPLQKKLPQLYELFQSLLEEHSKYNQN